MCCVYMVCMWCGVYTNVYIPPSPPLPPPRSCPHTPIQDVVPDWQTAASTLLTTLGLLFADKVLSELLGKFPPGGNPHYFVVKSLGQLANCNGGYCVRSLTSGHVVPHVVCPGMVSCVVAENTEYASNSVYTFKGVEHL